MDWNLWFSQIMWRNFSVLKRVWTDCAWCSES